jgi:dipeptidyl aminopeptidase/acylaminoacyl peptidase
MTTPKQAPVQPDDLYELRLLSDPQIAPDASRIVYTLQRVDREQEKKYSNLWMVSAQGGAPRSFTTGDQTDRQPRWSPDGRFLAFLSNRDDEKQFNLYRIPTDGGEAQRLTDWKGEFADFAWSPDSKQLVIQFRKKDPEAVEREQDETKKRLGIVARRISRLDYKADGSGYVSPERWHLWTLDMETGEALQLTNGDVHDERNPAWSPDGEQIVFVSNRTPQPDLDPLNDELWIMPATGGEMRRIETFSGRKASPRFSPDGQWIAFTGSEGLRQFWRNLDLWIVPADGSGSAHNLTGPQDVNVGNVTLSDVAPYGLDAAPIWRKDSQSLFVPVSQHGRTFVWSVPVAGDEPEVVVYGDGAVAAFSVADDGTMAYQWTTPSNPGQLWRRDPSSGEVIQLTTENDALLAQWALGRQEEVWIDGPDGVRLQGWILLPPGFDPTKRYPAILEIHGGPMLQYGQTFFHEFHFLAGQGYVVFFTNPRGSRGYGNDFVSAIVGDFGGPAYADLMAWTDYVAALPYVDENRLGVTGGSYGGYMTNWIVGHTDRFQGAVTQRSLSNLISFNGSSDVWLFELLFAGKPAWEALEDYWRQSPLAYVGNVTTPTLIIHSEQDLRVAQEQAEQFFKALRSRGVKTELILFPEESHGLSRGGRTDRRVARLQHILRWFDEHVRGT